MKLRNIVILEKDVNKKGDLFGRLMSDLFHTLGYDEPRLNIHKSGREIDLTSFHRTEDKVAIAECKAHAETIGGSDINKFVGVIDAEKRKFKKDPVTQDSDVIGYFVSLSGFKETAIEQERDLGNKRVILIKPEKVVEELIRGRILVSIEKAISSASVESLQIEILPYVDLLAYQKGWVWVLYYSDSHGQATSHFTFVHAEGKPLIKDLAQEIVSIDAKLDKIFQGLTILNSEDPKLKENEKLVDAQKKYFKYLENELGEIQFEGLPTDKEAGSVKVQLENIFVPLHLTQSNKKNNRIDIEEKREGIGKVLNKKSRLAILAKPGGGKSTMIKRIAIAYAFPERRSQIKDNLPDKNWFPIFLRCRELGERVTHSITEIINGIPLRAEIHSCTEEFAILVSNSLQNGNALLLIDGLDEIAEDKSRITFVNQLRTFIATYPTINIIVTSREAGFRVVGGSLATYCENYTVSNLVNSEIEELCLKWHKAIIDDSENTTKEAKKLSDLILKDSRIKALAENPLLLTTLLFVKRWAGYLPTKRSVLYQEMIKLLLVTWNVEGHEIIDIEEAEPQLAFVAYWMTKNGQQTISADELNSCLIDARKQMPEILGYTNISPSEFIKRVESRSSLLILSGHKRLESGIITAVYEFLHLSFQEYLTAKAIVKKFIPQKDALQKVVEIIKPNIDNENWKEVIPLSAVLLERDTKELIEYLIAETITITKKSDRHRVRNEKLAPALLGSCLANEIQIGPDLLGIAIEWYAKCDNVLDRSSTEVILKNKFSATFRQKVKECFFEKYDDKYISRLGSVLGEVFNADVKNPDDKKSTINEMRTGLASPNKEDRCLALLGLMNFAFNLSRSRAKLHFGKSDFKDIFIAMPRLLSLNDKHYNFCICWSVAWSAAVSIFDDSLIMLFLPSLSSIWVNAREYNQKRVAAWALSVILTPNLSPTEVRKTPNLLPSVMANYNNPNNEFDKLVAIYFGTLLGERWDIREVAEVINSRISRSYEKHRTSGNIYQFAEKLGIEIKNK